MKTKTSIFAVASLVGGALLSQVQADAPAAVAPRTSAYADVMINAAADNSVLDFTKRPTLIGDQQYVVGAGLANDLGNAAFSMKGMGFNWFGMVVRSDSSRPDIATAGLSTTDWGAGLSFAFGKNTVDNGTTETKTTYNMDGIALFGNFRLSSNSDVYGRVGMRTDYDGNTLDNYMKVGAIEKTNSIIGAMAGWKLDAGKEGEHALNAEVMLDMGNKEDPTVGDTAKITSISAAFYHGYIVKSVPGFGVFAGSSTMLHWHSETANNVDFSTIYVSVAPNIEFQKTLGKGFEVFTGAASTLLYSKDGAKPTGGTESTETNIWTTFTDVTGGLRWSFENFAVEGRVMEALLFDGPNVVGGRAPGLFGHVGVSAGF